MAEDRLEMNASAVRAVAVGNGRDSVAVVGVLVLWRKRERSCGADEFSPS